MAYYYQYDFISPLEIYSIVKEELKSYFDTGVIDDLLFPTYTDKCLRKLGRSSYKITEDFIVIEDFQATLPDNFYAVREAWMTTVLSGSPFRNPSSFYSQSDSIYTTQLSPVTIGGTPCSSNCSDPDCPQCEPVTLQAVFKTSNEVMFTYQKSFLLKPGRISSDESCDFAYNENWRGQKNFPGDSNIDSFEVRGNKFFTNFREGVVHLRFYTQETDEAQNQLVPDNYRILEFIELFIKYKCFEQLFNNVNDESFKQNYEKMNMYKALADEAFILADVEIKKQTRDQKISAIKRSLRRNRRFELPDKSNNSKWRRNG